MPRLCLRVPRGHGSLLCAPELDHWSTLLSDNARRFAATHGQVGGLALAELRRRARRDALAESAAYLARFAQAPAGALASERPLVVLGHQPQLYHPGVWIKSFAASGLARCAGGIALNVLADNDTLKGSTIVVPAGRADSAILAHVALDRWEGEVPFEERNVLDEAVFARFARTALGHMKELPFRPLLERYWREVLGFVRATPHLGDRLSAARRVIEAQMGCHTADVPLGRLCEGEAFRRLAAEVLLRREEFWEHHNRCLAAYRQLNRVHSRTHPVPPLERDGAWTEVPFWTWSSAAPRRRRLFVRGRAGELEFRAGTEPFALLPAAGSDPVSGLAAALADGLRDRKLRPRALMTTIFLRLLIADLFIHGVGGGKYDELTDEIVQRFFGIEPPAFVILSATALLPVGDLEFDPARLAELTRLQRDFFWNPDRYLEEVLRDQEPIAGQIERKFELMQTAGSTRAERRARYREFRAINEQLRPYLGTGPADLQAQLTELIERQHAAQIIRSREFAYCLHPFESLQRLFDPVLTFSRIVRDEDDPMLKRRN